MITGYHRDDWPCPVNTPWGSGLYGARGSGLGSGEGERARGRDRATSMGPTRVSTVKDFACSIYRTSYV